MNFDRLARHYDWMETLCGGGLLQRARTFWLDELQNRQKILSVGEGHGRFADACVRRFPKAKLTCIDASNRMLRRAKDRLGIRAQKVHWHRCDLATWSPTDKYDAIVTCFFLDCFAPETLNEMVAKLAKCANPDAVWLVVDFNIPARGFGRWRARVIHALMYFSFRLTVGLPARRLTPPDNLLRSHGFTLTRRREFSRGLLRADLWSRQ